MKTDLCKCGHKRITHCEEQPYGIQLEGHCFVGGCNCAAFEALLETEQGA